ncbi:RNA-binding protein 48-like [Fagus crenata]
MPRYKDEPPAVRVYTVCDESRYLIVRNVPALGCGDDLFKLFSSYGDLEECKPMDGEECEPFTDVYWIKFRLVSNARFAKKKLDEFVFLGNRLQVSYAPQFESLSDTKDKLEGRRREVLARLNPVRSKGPPVSNPGVSTEASLVATPSEMNYLPNPSQMNYIPQQINSSQRSFRELSVNKPIITQVSSDKDYFASQSMNQTVRLVREKFNQIQSSSEHLQDGSASKKARVDNRRRI